MLRYIVRCVIGGRSGKRESAVLMMILWLIGVGFLAGMEVQGHHLSLFANTLMFAGPFVFGWYGVAFGMEWVAKQTNWGGEADGEPGDMPFTSRRGEAPPS